MKQKTYNFKFSYQGKKYNLNAVMKDGEIVYNNRNQAETTDEFDDYWIIYFSPDENAFEMQFSIEEFEHTDNYMHCLVWGGKDHEAITDSISDVEVTIR